MKRSICFLLIAVLSLSLLSGCATKKEEELGVAEDWVGVADGEEKTEPDTEKKPASNQAENKNPASEEKDPANDKQEAVDKKDPVSDKKEPTGEQKTPVDEQKDPYPDEKEPEETPITKEESGTPITFLMQNLRTAGNQTGLDINERSGGDLNLYRRKYRFKQLVLKQDPDVILAQECTQGWLDFFQTDEYFAKTYTVLWVWRSKDGSVMQATPLLYKTKKYTMMESGHFWFSETPKTPSPSHGYTMADGEGHFRPCTWAKLKDKSTGAVFYAYSIHMDAGNDTCGTKSMNQIFELFEKIGKDAYAFLGGDFNFGFRDKYYDLAVDTEYQVDLQNMAANMKEDGLCEIGGANGSLHTKYDQEDDPETPLAENYFHGIFPDPNPGRKRQLDHIFAKIHPHMAVDYWGFDYTDYEDPAHQVEQGYISDHYGLVCKVRIGTEPDYSRYHYENKGDLAAAER